MRITKNLEDLKSRIADACRQAGRNENGVAILAVSKGHGPEAVREAALAGLHSFGENYLQEALPKIRLSPAELEWHFIGRIQSNKTRAIAENFAWVHTVATRQVADRLARQRPSDMPALNVCVQIDTEGTGEHDGVQIGEAGKLCAHIANLDGLRLRGLMTIPLPRNGLENQRIPLRRLREVYSELRAEGYMLDTLSMGMTADLEAAVLEGSTMLRIGTALFGPRRREVPG